MREVISLHIGQAGVQISTNIWELYCLEHGIDEAGKSIVPSMKSDFEFEKDATTSNDNNSVSEIDDDFLTKNRSLSNGEGFGSFFTEMSSGIYKPRAVLIDLEPSVIDQVRNGKFKYLYDPSCMVNSNEDAANNYARGHYTTGNTALCQILEPIRKISETCDKLQGFLLTHSYGGGTGSGLGSLIQLSLEEEWFKKSILEIAVFPSPKLSTAVVEPYNAVLTTHSTMDVVDCAFLVDNEAMYGICQKNLEVECPEYINLNRLLAQTVSSITASLRFRGSLNADFSDFQTNLVPFPRIHFPVISYAPIINPHKLCHDSSTVAEITSKSFDSSNRLVYCESELGLYMACCLLYRGDVAPKDVNAAISQIKKKKEVNFVDWSPTGFKVGLNNRRPHCVSGGDMAETRRAVCMLCNTTSIKNAWSTLITKYNNMMEKKAFFHWYTGEGMDEAEFFEAFENLLSLEQDYNVIAGN